MLNDHPGDDMSGARAIKKRPPALNTFRLNNGGCTADVNVTGQALPVYVPIQDPAWNSDIGEEELVEEEGCSAKKTRKD